MEAIATLAILFVLIGVWIAIARSLKKKSTGFFLRHLAGSTGASIATVVTVAVLLATGIVAGSDEGGNSVPGTVVAQTQESSLPDDGKEASEEQPTESGQSTVAPTPDLGITAEIFASRFNKALGAMEVPFKAPSKPVIAEGPAADSFSLMLNDYIAITATVNKSTGAVYELMLIGSGDGSAASGLNVIKATTAMFMAASDTVDKNGRQSAIDTFMKLTDKLDAQMDEGSASTYLSGMKYSIARPKDMGTWVSVAPAY